MWLVGGYGEKTLSRRRTLSLSDTQSAACRGANTAIISRPAHSFDGSDDNSDTVGDQHPWFIGFGDRDYFKYRTKVSRFPNKGGMLGPTSLPNMMACFSKGQDFCTALMGSRRRNLLLGTGTNCSPDLMLERKAWHDDRTA